MKPSLETLLAIKLMRRVLLRHQGGFCALCGQQIRRVWQVSIEHVVPRSLGGFWGLGNIVGAHGDCNARKADRMPTGCELIWLLAVNARLDVQPQRWAA